MSRRTVRIKVGKVAICHERLQHSNHMISCLPRGNLREISLGESSIITIKIRRFSVQTLQGTPLALETQLCYEAPIDLRVKIVKTQ